MDKLYYSSLSSEQKEIIENQKTQASHRAITSMRQAEEVKQELLDSGFIEGQDFSFEDHELSTKTTDYEFQVVVDGKSTWRKHEFEINYYAGSIELLWKEVRQTYNEEEDQSHVTPDNPSGWKIVDASEYLKLATKKYNRWDNNYYGKYGNYMEPLTISGTRNFCKSYRDVNAKTYLKRLREATKNAPEVLKRKLQEQVQEMSKKQKIAEAKEVLTSQFDDIFLSKTKVVFNSYHFKLEIRFPEKSGWEYSCDTIYIDYDPDRNFECSVNKVENRYGFIPWDKVSLIEQLQTEQVEA